MSYTGGSEPRAALGAALVLSVLASGCGLNMEKHYQKMRGKLAASEYDDAAAYIDSVKEEFYSKDNRLLYYMDKGMVLHLAKRYDESNAILEKAKATAEELWTESIGANAAAWLTTDNSIPYQGEDFEKVLLHFVAALNYIGLGRYEAARVEARQVTNKLELYNQAYAAENGVSVYKDDAFARWLAGKLSETEGPDGYNDAWIDYKKALAVYEKDYAARYHTPVPRVVVEDAVRVLTALGSDFEEELAEVRARYPGVAPPGPAETRELGEVVLLHMAGEAPYKVDRYWHGIVGTRPDDYIRIAYPAFVPKHHAITGVRVTAGGRTVESELAENITAIAVQNLNDHMGRIKAKAITRAVTKYLTAKTTRAVGENLKNKEAGAALQLAGALFQVGSVIAEEADKRSWITLPAAVNVVRVFVPAGDVTLDVELVGRDGRAARRVQIPAKAVAGRPTFVSYRTLH